ncbi:hypothetical protein Pan153_19450 [Gimesia panareensis]|uniref:Carboxypeptidase regulatory-like domain-containing protein n=1 Tax=Gimesia panareensis TaxID=2527978 RepID=A0A518FLW2_9PLAN|nr:hypothetical protein [Gimesia panareensis]QDV17310.1 hypothetical protein Pan153_19450 [Gimesia panareensis]
MRTTLLIMVLAVTLPGCGGSIKEYPTANVTGKVTCNGEPVANVRVYFAPIAKSGGVNAGKSGSGSTKEDGTFTISTYGTEDGAVVGSHNVMVDSPHPEHFPNFTCKCRTDGNKPVKQVEVTADGENHFEISMTLKTKAEAARPSLDADDLDDLKKDDE